MATKKKAPNRTATRRAVDDTADVRIGRSDAPDGVVVMRGTDGLGLLVPRALRSATPAQRAAITELEHVAGALQIGQEKLEQAVQLARRAGLSWSSIGWCVGLTGQAVRQRFGD